jgi:phage shock protein C
MRRIPERGVIAGVCAGIAEYFDWNVRLLRAILVIVFIFSGAFPILVIYAVLWYVMDPVSEADYRERYSRSFTEPAGGGAHATSERPATMTELKARFARLEERLGSMEECITSNEFELRRELKKLES